MICHLSLLLTLRPAGMQVATEELTPAGPAVVRLFNVLFSVSLSSPLTQHPSAVGPIFYLLRLALRHAVLVGAQERRQRPVSGSTLKAATLLGVWVQMSKSTVYSTAVQCHELPWTPWPK